MIPRMGTQGRYVPAIDGLRAVAVLAVVAYHAGLPVPGGYAGVDVFFVISGYLITRLLQQQLEEAGRIDFRDFYVRRIRRIYPALVTVIAATLALSVLLGVDAHRQVSQSALASLLMGGNLYFQAVTGNYFDAESDHMPLLHLWSLGVEEQFYLVWPLLLTFVIRNHCGRLVAIAATSFLLAEWLLRTNPEAAFFQTPARAWELAAGAWLAMRHLPAHPPKWASWLGVALLAAAIALPQPGHHFPGAGALPAVLGALLVIYSSREPVGAVGRVLSSRPFVFVGLISYSLYLWHWPLLALHRAAGLPTTVSTAVTLCLASVGLATLSYRYIETPLRRHPAPGALHAATALCVSCALALAAAAALVTPTPTSPDRGAQGPFIIEKRNVECLVALDKREPPGRNCRPAGAEVVLWGDSHASAWLPFARSLGGVADFTKSACAPALGWAHASARHPSLHDDCIYHNKAAVEYIRRGGVNTVVMAASLKDRGEAADYIGQGVDAIAPAVKRILLMVPTPQLKQFASICIQSKLDCDVSRAEYDAETAPVRQVYATIAARHPNVTVVEVADFFCTEHRCPVVRYDFPLYLDKHHITRHAAERFAATVQLD